MSQIAVVYWSGTGHTQAMAEAVAKACGAQLLTAEEFSADQVAKYDAIAFGCPAMGAEVLEESEFRADVRRLQAPSAGQKDRVVRLLWLGRRRMDAQLGRGLHLRRRDAGLRQRHLPG